MLRLTQKALGLAVLALQASALRDISKYINFGGELTEFGKQAVEASKGTLESRGIMDHLNISYLPQAYGRVEKEAQFFKDHGSKRTVMKYGPFTMPPMTKDDGMVDYLLLGAPMPCAGCKITWMQAGLEFPNGTYANANTSMWLHHTVMINGMNPDTVCGRDYYGVGERWFASGNERTPVNMALDGHIPVGYDIGLADMQFIEIELMNQAMVPQEAVMTIEFEYIPMASVTKEFASIKPIWLDIAGCDIASEMPVINNKAFNYKMNQSYTPKDWSGAIVGVGSHLHDGGTHLNITNKGNKLCNTMAYYGGGGYEGMNMDMSGMMPHISEMTSCYAPYVGQLEKDAELNIQAFYDFEMHEGMTRNDGSLDDIMGIAVMFVAQNMSAATMAKYAGKFKPDDEPPQPSPPLPGATTGKTVGMDMGMGGMSGMDMGGMHKSG